MFAWRPRGFETVGRARLVISRQNNSPWSLAWASLLGGAVAAMPTDPATARARPRRQALPRPWLCRRLAVPGFVGMSPGSSRTRSRGLALSRRRFLDKIARVLVSYTTLDNSASEAQCFAPSAAHRWLLAAAAGLEFRSSCADTRCKFSRSERARPRSSQPETPGCRSS